VPTSVSPEPKIELHVHLEGTVRPRTLLAIARRNGYDLGARTVEELRPLYRCRSFADFVRIWELTTRALQRYDDFRRIVVAYARDAAAHGAVYVEACFSPLELAEGGSSLDAVFAGFCDGAQEACELHGVRVRLTPEFARGRTVADAEAVGRRAIAFRDRGVVGLGLSGYEGRHGVREYARVFAEVAAQGLAAVPHAGELCGADAVREVVDALAPRRIRHGIRALEDRTLLERLVEARIVLDVCLTSNLRTGVVPSLRLHPLPRLLEAGVLCSISTDDPALFGTDLSKEYALAARLWPAREVFYDAGVAGALCDPNDLPSRVAGVGRPPSGT
jgi:aminodeoxyfutalosine deaminase